MKIDFSKQNGLIPAIIQDAQTLKVLMLGYMNKEALQETRQNGQVTFFSRSRQKLWTKGETSGHFLDVVEIIEDCDKDTLLIKVHPHGPVCHTGRDTCFDESNTGNVGFLMTLESVIEDRKRNPRPESYTSTLLQKGIPKIAQKVGEEATETVIDAVGGNTERYKEEAADLLYHLLVLNKALDVPLSDIMEVLRKRHG
ncbi:MAG: bifunctional phosphoribosyl-AMP cyclohydrolase/phosphoribosyl-ATP diphosphatase HisIE [Caldithrix sp.]|nr:bifunctional phosphoribosyl-AMP cyclohydrolase/phosphoribosyl-ATP diphosphatase HisIE [Caldithrix sp.]